MAVTLQWEMDNDKTFIFNLNKCNFLIDKEMNINSGIVCGVAAVAAFAAGMACGGGCSRAERVRIVTVRDTLTVVRPVARDSVVVRRVVVRVPVAENQPESENLSARADSVAPAGADSVSVALDIESVRYSGPGYTAWVSGHMARLDSLRLFSRTEVPVEVREPKRRGRWTVSAGVGLTAGPRGVEPGVFVGVGFSILSIRR